MHVRYTHHVESLEHLTLVARTITVEGESAGLFAHVLLGEADTGSYWDLGTDDTVSTKEGGGEDVHGAALSMGHPGLAPQKLGNNTLDGTATHDSEGMAAVRGDDTVILGDTMLQTDGNGFLYGTHQTSSARQCHDRTWNHSTNLADSEMAEAADELGLVEGVGGHLHAAHGRHLPVHRQQLGLGDLHVEVGGVAEVGAEGLFMELEGDGLREVRGQVAQLGGVGRRLDAADVRAQGGWPYLDEKSGRVSLGCCGWAVGGGY
jgi:hypothetical protein